MQIVYIPPKPSQYCVDQATYTNVQKELHKVRSLKKKTSLACALVTLSLTQINTYASDLNIDQFTSQVDAKGLQLLSLIQSLGYWAAILFAGIDILKNLKKQDTPAIIAVVLKYVTIYAILYALPWIFDLIKTLFVF